MAGTYPIGRGVRVEVQNTLGSDKTITDITQANPGVASSTSHGMANGTVGFLSSVEGMVTLEGQACAVDDTATNAFDLEKIKTTNLPAFSGSALFSPVSTWHTVGNSTSVDIGGGAAAEQNQTTLIDDNDQIRAGLLAAQTVTISGFSDFESAAMIAIAEAAGDQANLVFKVTLKDGQRRIFRGVPSLPGESLSVGQTATGTFDVKVTGKVIYLPAVS